MKERLKYIEQRIMNLQNDRISAKVRNNAIAVKDQQKEMEAHANQG